MSRLVVLDLGRLSSHMRLWYARGPSGREEPKLIKVDLSLGIGDEMLAPTGYGPGHGLRQLNLSLRDWFLKHYRSNFNARFTNYLTISKAILKPEMLEDDLRAALYNHTNRQV